MSGLSLRSIALLPPRERERAKRALRVLTAAELTEILYDWPGRAREEQLPPDGDWQKWLYLGGRGAGKTRAGAEWVRASVERGCKRIALVAATAADARDIMVLGESGILSVSPPYNRPEPVLSRRRLIWPNGAIAMLFSADEPERLRGHQHDAAWCDEIASWRYARDAWDMLMFGLRLGDRPRVCVTTTPRPTDILIGTGQNGRMLGLLNDPGCVLTRGSSYRNRANLAADFFNRIIRQYEGTRLGRQELNAEILEELGGLWSRAMIEAARYHSYHSDHDVITNVSTNGDVITPVSTDLELVRVVVAIDPAVTNTEGSDETGIIVAGKDRKGDGYVLSDLSGKYSPEEWARVAIAAYRTHAADRIVAETNNGGDLVEATLRVVDQNIPFTGVRATRGKFVRAEPIAALYEQSRIHHCGAFPILEDQMVSFTTDWDTKASGFSPDRVDALVWALTDLLVEPEAHAGFMQHVRNELATLREAQ